jgi:hypothetical protein
MATETETVTSAPEKASRWEDFIDVIFSPGELFDRRANDGWFKPFLILCAVCIVLYYVLLPVTAGLWEAMMRENAPPNATPAQIEQSASVMKWFYGIMVPFGFLLVIATSAVGIKLVSSLLEPASTWRQAFTISTYSMFVAVPQTVLIALAVMIKNQTGGNLSMADSSFGVMRFTGSDLDPVMRTLLTRVDLFAIWSAVLVAIGLIHVVRMEKSKAIIAAAIVWALIAVPSLAGAAFSPR